MCSNLTLVISCHCYIYLQSLNDVPEEMLKGMIFTYLNFHKSPACQQAGGNK